MFKQISVLFLSIIVTFAFATPQNEIKKSNDVIPERVEQQVLDEFRNYVATVPDEIRQEVVEFRKIVAKLNKEKRVAYQQLSQAAQNYLAKEQEFKKKLPIKQRKEISIQPNVNTKGQ